MILWVISNFGDSVILKSNFITYMEDARMLLETENNASTNK